MKILLMFLLLSTLSLSETIKKAYFAGGCFWCMEAPFEKLDGVKEAISGYAGGSEINPSYKEVASGNTGHKEAVEVIFDSDIISYDQLLDVFWRQINPTDNGGQFVDRGFQYSTGIFYVGDLQRSIASQSKERYDKLGVFKKDIVTPILPYTTFYKAEEYHQDYYKKSSLKYKYYRSRSGRDKYLNSIWKK